MTSIRFLYSVVWVSFSVLLFAACTKENIKEPDPQATGKKLSRIEYEDGYQNITYNDNGTVSKIVVHTEHGGNSSGTETFSFLYNGTKLAEIHSNTGVKYTYTYNGNLVTRTEVFNANGVKAVWYDYAYQNGRLWKTEIFASLPGDPNTASPYSRFEQEYDAKGNIEKVMVYYRDPFTHQLKKSWEYVMDGYDTKKNTAILFESNPYIPLEDFNPNNPLKELRYDAQAVLDETVIHSYTYDAAGRPLTRKTITRAPGQPDQEANTIFHY